ncbi:hypothetical protein DV735_g4345, partial [Chaetothyriales sp. CBS 134920]
MRSALRRDGMPPPPPLTPSKRDALERTMVGYEESQKLIARANEEIEQLRATVRGQAKQLSMTGARIEKLMEQVGNEKQQNEEMRIKYVQEVKKVRKQCFQAEQAQLQAQGNLADVKKELRKKEAELAHAKQRREEAKQEAFERAYAVAGVTEEKEVAMHEKEAAVQELRNHARRWAGRIEQEASSASRRAHEMVRITSQSEQLAEDRAAQVAVGKRQALREPEHHCHLAASGVARPFFSDFVEYKAGERALFGEVFTLEDHIAELYREVAYYRRKLDEARQEIDLMCMECQLQICECRRAEKQGKRFIHDVDFDVKLQDERAAKKQRLEEDHKAQTLPPLPSVEESMHPDHQAALEVASQVPLPDKDDDEQERESRESTPTATAALEEMTQVLVAPTHIDTELKFTFSVSRSHEAHSQPAPGPLPPRSESAMESSDMDMFDLSPPKHQPRRPSTALGIQSSYIESRMRHVPDLGRATTDRGHTMESMSQHVEVRDRTAPRSTHPNSTLFPITPKAKGTSLHTRSQTASAVPMLHQSSSQSFATRTTTTRVPLRGAYDEEEAMEMTATAMQHGEYPRTPHTPFDGRQSQSSGGTGADPRATRPGKIAQCQEDPDDGDYGDQFG